MVRYGEIYLKGLNRPYFLKALVRRVKEAVREYGAEVWLYDARIYVKSGDNTDECVRRIKKVFGVHSLCVASIIDKNSFDRQMINRQIGNILSESGISISDNEEYTFTVDAYTNRITVDGSDKGKAAEIENVLNKGQNGKNLYDHIRLCGTWENNSQIFKEGQTLRYSNELVKELIGVNLAECTQNGNDFITPDNRSVKEMLHKYAKANPTDGFTVESHTKLLHSYIDHASEFSYSDRSTKMDLSIKFNSTGLHDIGQKNSYGNGDTGWINDYVNDLSVSSGKKVLTTFI